MLDFELNGRIVIEWPGEGAPTRVAWTFDAREDGTTFVSIINTGLTGTPEEMTAQAINSTEGFAFVLAGLKAWLEHGISLNLVADRFPDGLDEE